MCDGGLSSEPHSQQAENLGLQGCQGPLVIPRRELSLSIPAAWPQSTSQREDTNGGWYAMVSDRNIYTCFLTCRMGA